MKRLFFKETISWRVAGGIARQHEGMYIFSKEAQKSSWPDIAAGIANRRSIKMI